MSHGDSKKVVIAALTGNGLIAITKFVAASVTGSSAMLAEAVHSLADTGNQLLLMLGMRLSRGASTDTHPFGRGVERYFWPFVVSIMIFSVGGAFALYEGTHKFFGDAAHSDGGVSRLWNYGVLTMAVLFEGYAFAIAMREFRHVRGSRSTFRALTETRDPTIPTVILEDFAALTGLVIALTGIGLSDLTGWPGWDALATIAIGALLCAIAFFLAKETHSLLVGESASPTDRQRVRDVVEQVEGIETVTQLLSLHRGPQDVLLALKVRFARGLDVGGVEAVTNTAEQAIRAELPQMRHIFIEADGLYDIAADPERGGHSASA